MKEIVFYGFLIIWYLFSTLGYYYITTKDIIKLKLIDKILIFVLSLFFPIILGILGFASIMVRIEYKITKMLKYED